MNTSQANDVIYKGKYAYLNSMNGLDRSKEIKKIFQENNEPENSKKFKKKTPYGVIYVIENLIDGKKYIGKTKDYSRRGSEYVRYATDINSINVKKNSMYRIIQSVGILNFRMRKLYYCKSESELATAEIHYINIFKTYNPEYGYNNLSHRWETRTLTDEERKRLSEAHMDIKHPASARRKRENRVLQLIWTKRSFFYVIA